MVVERLSSSSWVPPWLEHQHLARYGWVAPLTAGGRVIDCACGTGYGTKMLRDWGAREVIGFDLSPDAIREARQSQGGDGIHFAVADASALPVESHGFDAFVSLETIEHVADDRAFLAEAKRVLRPGGTFVCSTPNRLLTNPGTSLRDRPFNRFHLREYTAAELEALMREQFPRVELFGQTPFGVRYQKALAGMARIHRMLAVRVHQVRKMCGIPWERRDKHCPRPITDGHLPEVLVVVCIA